MNPTGEPPQLRGDILNIVSKAIHGNIAYNKRAGSTDIANAQAEIIIGVVALLTSEIEKTTTAARIDEAYHIKNVLEADTQSGFRDNHKPIALVQDRIAQLNKEEGI